MVVPWLPAAGPSKETSPPSTEIRHAWALSLANDVMFTRATDAMEGSASPRKPSFSIRTKSPSGSLEVACRSSANRMPSGLMPWPSSSMRISALPPSRRVTEIRLAPASMAFSTSSFTTLAGRSTTSPAAIWFTKVSGSLRISGKAFCGAV